MLKLGNIKVSYKLATMLVACIIGSLILLLIAANTLKHNLITEREARLNAVLHATLSQVTLLQKSLPEQQAKDEVKSLVRALRYDGNNYVFIIDENRTAIVHPLKPELEGKQMGNNGETFWATMVETAKNGQDGKLTYLWKTANGSPADKLSHFVKYYDKA